VPMIVVVPDAHALPFETILATKPGLFPNLDAFWAQNEKTADEELFHDIIPFIQTRYNISDEPRERAIAGFSMGGLQAMETGIVHLGYFSWKNRDLLLRGKITSVVVVHRGLFFQPRLAYDFPIPSEAGHPQKPLSLSSALVSPSSLYL